MAILFYGWQSSVEGLSLGEARDTTFTLSGVIAWVGKPAQLTTKPVSLSNGRQLITQAIAEGHIEPRGPGHPCSIPPALMPFSFCNQDLFPQLANLPVTAEWCEVSQLGQDSRSEARCCIRARIETRDNKSYGWLHPSHLHSHQTMDLRVVGAWHQLHHQSCQFRTGTFSLLQNIILVVID